MIDKGGSRELRELKKHEREACLKAKEELIAEKIELDEAVRGNGCGR